MQWMGGARLTERDLGEGVTMLRLQTRASRRLGLVSTPYLGDTVERVGRDPARA